MIHKTREVRSPSKQFTSFIKLAMTIFIVSAIGAMCYMLGAHTASIQTIPKLPDNHNPAGAFVNSVSETWGTEGALVLTLHAAENNTYDCSIYTGPGESDRQILIHCTATPTSDPAVLTLSIDNAQVGFIHIVYDSGIRNCLYSVIYREEHFEFTRVSWP